MRALALLVLFCGCGGSDDSTRAGAPPSGLALTAMSWYKTPSRIVVRAALANTSGTALDVAFPSFSLETHGGNTVSPTADGSLTDPCGARTLSPAQTIECDVAFTSAEEPSLLHYSGASAALPAVAPPPPEQFCKTLTFGDKCAACVTQRCQGEELLCADNGSYLSLSSLSRNAGSEINACFSAATIAGCYAKLYKCMNGCCN
jgi:hypothetical protein